MFNALGTGMDWISAKAPIFADWFGVHIWPTLAAGGQIIADLVSTGFDILSGWWDKHGDAVITGFSDVGDAIGHIVSAGLQGLSDWWDNNGDTVTGGIQAIGDFINDPVLPALDSLWHVIRDDVYPWVKKWVEWMANNEYILKGFAFAIGTVLVVALSAYIATTLAAFAATLLAWAPVVLITLALGFLAAALFYAYENWGWFRTGVLDAIAILYYFGQGMQAVVDWLKTAYDWAKKLVDTLNGIKIPGTGGSSILGGAIGGATKIFGNPLLHRPVIRRRRRHARSPRPALACLGGRRGDDPADPQAGVRRVLAGRFAARRR